MKRILMTAMLLSAFLSVWPACSPDDDPVAPRTETPEQDIPDTPAQSDENDNNDKNDDDTVNREIVIRVGGRSFAATLEDTRAGNAFAALLPMTVRMNELNGNEKYCYLPEDLPTESRRPATIRNGDLMLFGSNCLVLFYETFPTSYSYTRIGRIIDPDALPSAVGRGSATVTFEATEK